MAVELNYDEMLSSTLMSLVDSIFTGKWTAAKSTEQEIALETFKALVKFVEDLRKQFDDTLTVEQLKGNLSSVEHIRKPYEKKASEKPTNMAEYLKQMNAKKR
jgi:hypothetical protein